MCILIHHLVQLAQKKSVARCTDCPDMTTAVDWDIKRQTKQTIHFDRKKSKEVGKDQESIQSSTTPDPGHHMGK